MIFEKFRQRQRNSRRGSLPAPRIPDGLRVYAVGDVHGRDDLLEELLGRIRADIADRPGAKNHLVMLGDLIDRGPDSRGVVERIRCFAEKNIKLHVISGNHEEILLRLLEGQSDLVGNWLRFGGTETLESYGVEPLDIQRIGLEAGLRLIRSAIPAEHRAFFRSLVDTVRIGDYLFVHAGVRPQTALEAQSVSDFHWIREPFLSDQSDHGFVVVHGHTVTDEVVDRPNRIGIDTGAYATGRLTALALEAEHRWLLTTTGTPG